MNTLATLAALALSGCITVQGGIETRYGSATFDGKTIRVLARPGGFAK